MIGDKKVEEKKHGSMNLLNAIPMCGMDIPKLLVNKLTVLSNCILNDVCVCIFNKCLFAISKQLECEGKSNKDIISTNVVFSDRGTFNLQMEDITLGFHVDFCFYNLTAILFDKGNDEILIAGCFIEELAHHYWFIDDEVDVKYKVYEILKHIYPDVTLEKILGGLY